MSTNSVTVQTTGGIGYSSTLRASYSSGIMAQTPQELQPVAAYLG
jgi:hypothetical protein